MRMVFLWNRGLPSGKYSPQRSATEALSQIPQWLLKHILYNGKMIFELTYLKSSFFIWRPVVGLPTFQCWKVDRASMQKARFLAVLLFDPEDGSILSSETSGNSYHELCIKFDQNFLKDSKDNRIPFMLISKATIIMKQTEVLIGLTYLFWSKSVTQFRSCYLQTDGRTQVRKISWLTAIKRWLNLKMVTITLFVHLSLLCNL
jgi:hypothetical protein